MNKYIKGFILVLFFLFTLLISVNVSADMGPKPYVRITLEGNTNGMYMTLLSDKRTGPWCPIEEHDHTEYIDSSLKDAHLKFASYVDNDGYKYLQYLESVSDNYFSWNYRAPDNFKILIYDSINDKFITDNVVYERFGMGTSYNLILNDSSFTVNREINPWLDVLGFFIRLGICLLIELAIATMYGLKGKKEFRIILIVNIATQLILNLTLTLMTIFIGYKTAIIYPTYLLLELGIAIIEAILYLKLIKKTDENGVQIRTNKNLISYAIFANAASFVLGFIILGILQFFNLFI